MGSIFENIENLKVYDIDEDKILNCSSIICKNNKNINLK
jgi:hypothetical protein